MPVVTDLKIQVKNPNRVSVFIDKEFVFGLNMDQIYEYGVKKGSELEASDINRLKQASTFGKLKMRTLDWLLMRPHSIKETRDYLRKKEAAPEEVDKILEDLAKYLDDTKFAEFWVEQRRAIKGKSKRVITMELRQKGVDSNIIERALAEHELSDVDSLNKIILKKQKQTRYQDKQRLTQYLLRQGFSYSDVSEALAE